MEEKFGMVRRFPNWIRRPIVTEIRSLQAPLDPQAPLNGPMGSLFGKDDIVETVCVIELVDKRAQDANRVSDKGVATPHVIGIPNTRGNLAEFVGRNS